MQVSSTAPITGLVTTGLWPGDYAGPAHVADEYSGRFVDDTVAADLDCAGAMLQRHRGRF